MHTIKTRHQGGAVHGNAIDFFVWKDGDPTNGSASTCAFTITPERVGIGTANPQKNLSVNEIIEIKKNTYIKNDGPYLHLSNKKGLQEGLQQDPTTKTGILGRAGTTMGIKFVTPPEYEPQDTANDHVMAKIEYKLDRGAHLNSSGIGWAGRNTGKLSFWTSSDGSNDLGERMVIDKLGNVDVNGEISVRNDSFVKTTEFKQQQKITTWDYKYALNYDYNPKAYDYFGYSVATSGDLLAVGAHNDDQAGTEAGAVYLFRKTNNNWSVISKIMEPFRYSANAYFGQSVSLHGNYLLVGQPGKDLVHFEHIDGGNAHTIKGSNYLEGSYFGNSVAINNDYAVVGAPYYNSNQGRVYIYKKRVSGLKTWYGQNPSTSEFGNEQIENQIITPAYTNTRRFGYSVAISNNNKIVIGEPYVQLSSTENGAAYIYGLDDNGNYIKEAELRPNYYVANSHFGWSVNIHNNFVIVGAPGFYTYQGRAYIYEKTSDSWGNPHSGEVRHQTTELVASTYANSDQFGSSVAIKNDTAYVGAFHKHDQRGEVFIFKRNNSVGSWGSVGSSSSARFESYSIRPFDLTTQNNFGWSIAINDSDNDLIIGARSDDGSKGAVYVFKQKALLLNNIYDNNDKIQVNTRLAISSGGKINNAVLELINENNIGNYIITHSDNSLRLRTTNASHHLYLCDWNTNYNSETGNVSIGKTGNEPQYPLDIFGYRMFQHASGDNTNLLFGNYRHGWYGGHTLDDDHDGGASAKISLRTERSIWVNNGAYLATSDKRIKTNIVDLSDNLALEMLRNIPCYYYNYKDKSSGIGKTIGFLAQEVKNIVPMAVSIQKGIIPNEMQLIQNPQWTKINDESNNKYKLTIPDLEDVSGNTKYKFYMSNDISGNDECEKNIYSLEDEPNSFIFDQSWNNVFLYGKEVNDFHTLDKQKLFAINFSATQEIDRIQQSQIADISLNKIDIEINQINLEEAKNKIDFLEAKNSELKSKVSFLETELNSLKAIVQNLVDKAN